ncbi:hypothetical protein [Lichenicoccus sp.]|uniref:hypothetical protein n=1 Tax=Lichenicoccus sp. TaxID=2781899 RepID=UPI003D0D496A
MVDQATVQVHVAGGLGKAASILGAELAQYRPTAPMDPLAAGNSMGGVFCAVDNPGLAFASPVPPDHPFSILLADPRRLLVGDYLVGEDTYFVSRIQPLQPAWCVLCNMTLDILDTTQPTSAGTNAYGGVTSGTNTLLARGWPMSVLSKTRGETDVTKLPSDTRSAFFQILLPAIPGLQIGYGLCLQDAALRIYDIMNYQLTDYGYKLLVGIATT